MPVTPLATEPFRFERPERRRQFNSRRQWPARTLFASVDEELLEADEVKDVELAVVVAFGKGTFSDEQRLELDEIEDRQLAVLVQVGPADDLETRDLPRAC